MKIKRVTALPDLPVELLPNDWLRSQASAMFYEYHDLLS